MPTIHRYSLSELTQPTGSLVSDPTSDSGQVWQVASAIDWGVRPSVGPGLTRVRFRLKRGAAVGTAQVITDSGAGTSNLVTTSWDAITVNDLPEAGVWYTVERVVRYGALAYWLALTGTWAGLLIDWIEVATLDEPVYVTRALPDRLRYDTGQSGTVSVGLVNTTNVPQSVTLRVRVESGLRDGRMGRSQTVTLAAPSDADRTAGADEQSFTLPLPALTQFGNTVIVEVLQAGAVVSSARDYCICHDELLRVSQYYGYRFPNSYTDVDAGAQLATMRRMYYGIAECYFWAPCDNSNLAPSESIWRSGQTRRRMGKAPLQAMIAAGHQQGLGFFSYADRFGFGWRVFKSAQQHPDFYEHETGTSPIHSYDVASLEAQEAADQGEDDTLPSTGMLTAAWGNPAAVAYHVAQLQASMRMFGWDGFRYDNGCPVIDPVVDVLGRQLPLGSWTDVQVIRALRAGIRAVNPRGLWGNNAGWNTEPRSLPLSSDLYTAQMERGGMVLMEGDTNGQGRTFGTYASEGALYAEAGWSALRYGGQQVCIIDPSLSGDDHFFQASMVAAGGCHLAYGVRDELRPLMQMLARHGDLFYAPDLTRPDTAPLTVSGSLLWQPFVRRRDVSPTRRQYLVHLFNVPNANLGSGASAPSPATNVALTWTLPAGWKATGAYAITPDGGYQVSALACTQSGTRVSMTVPKVLRYTAIVLEATGKATATPTTPRQDARAAPRPALTNPLDVLGTGGTVGFVLPTNEPPVRRVSEFSVPGSSTYTEGGAAYLRLGPTPLNLGFAPPIPRPGYYRLTARAKSLVTPPTGAALSGLIESAMNGATASANPSINTTSWPGASFPVNQWVTLTLDGVLTYPNFWCALSGGWDGLVLDTITIQRQRELTYSEIATTVTDGWGSQTVNTSSTAAFVGAGLYYADSGMVAALQGRGLTCTLAKAARFRGAVGLSTPFPTSPSALAGYRVIALHSIEARTLTPQQQVWLTHYVNAGGILVLTGGVYGFGNGGWGDSALTADLLPVVCARGDMRAGTAALSPVSSLASSVSWAAPPAVPWYHAFTAKSGATVECAAGGAPVIVSQGVGGGRVVCVGVAPCGVSASPYWSWSQWGTLLGKVIFGS